MKMVRLKIKRQNGPNKNEFSTYGSGLAPPSTPSGAAGANGATATSASAVAMKRQSSTGVVADSDGDDDYVSGTSSSHMSYSSSSQSNLTNLMDVKRGGGGGGGYDTDQTSSQPSSTKKRVHHHHESDDSDGIVLRRRHEDAAADEEEESRDDTTRSSYSMPTGGGDSVVGVRIPLNDVDIDDDEITETDDDDMMNPPGGGRKETDFPTLTLALSGNTSAGGGSGSIPDWKSSQSMDTADDWASLPSLEKPKFDKFVNEYEALNHHNHNKMTLPGPQDLCSALGCWGNNYEDDDADADAEIVPLVLEYDDNDSDDDDDDEGATACDDSQGDNNYVVNKKKTTDGGDGHPTMIAVESKRSMSFSFKRSFSNRSVSRCTEVLPPGDVIEKDTLQQDVHSKDVQPIVSKKWHKKLAKSIRRLTTAARMVGSGDSTGSNNKNMKRRSSQNDAAAAATSATTVETENMSLVVPIDRSRSSPEPIENVIVNTPSQKQHNDKVVVPQQPKLKGKVIPSKKQQFEKVGPPMPKKDTITGPVKEVKRVRTDAGRFAYLVIMDAESDHDKRVKKEEGIMEDGNKEVKRVRTDAGKYAYLVIKETELEPERNSMTEEEDRDASYYQLNKTTSKMSQSSPSPSPVEMNKSRSNSSLGSVGRLFNGMMIKDDKGKAGHEKSTFLPLTTTSSSSGSSSRPSSDQTAASSGKKMHRHENEEDDDVDQIDAELNLSSIMKEQDTTQETEDDDDLNEVEIELEEEQPVERTSSILQSICLVESQDGDDDDIMPQPSTGAVNLSVETLLNDDDDATKKRKSVKKLWSLLKKKIGTAK